jgi:hypothetical protein
MSRPPDPKPQADKFRDLARQIGADEDEKRFEETVRKVAQAPKDKPKSDKKSHADG